MNNIWRQKKQMLRLFAPEMKIECGKLKQSVNLFVGIIVELNPSINYDMNCGGNIITMRMCDGVKIVNKILIDTVEHSIS